MSLAVLAVSGALGFFILAFGFPDWQVAVETAQVLAGIVDYPPDNPFYIYHLKIWTVVHHVCAVLLLAGLSEIQLSILLSGLQGMLTFQAFAMFVYAFSRDAVLAVTSVLIIIVSGTAISGVTYPIFLLGTSHTYGALGLSTVALSAALLGCGHYRLALFLLALAPAVHASLGLWLILIVLVCLAMDVAGARRLLRDAWPYLAAGCAATLASLAVQWYMARNIRPIPARVSARYLASFTELWDEHRRPVSFDEMGVWINLGALTLAFIWLLGTTRIGRQADEPANAWLPPDSIFLLRFVAVAGAIGIGFVFLSWVSPKNLPAAFVMLMPTRLLNVNAMMFTALVFGLTGTYSRWWWGRWMSVLLAALLIVGSRSMLWDLLRQRGQAAGAPGIDSLAVLAVAAALLALGAVIARWRRPDTGPTGHEGRSLVAPVNVIRLALAGVVLWVAAGPVRAERRERPVVRDRTNDLVFAAAARGRGLLLTGGDLDLIQLRSRRPVLLNGGALDTIAYAHESAPALERILRDVYGIDLFNPPPGTPRIATVPRAYNRSVWQRYPIDRWREIRRVYGVTQVIVPSDWALVLPVAAGQRGRHLLYDIP